MRLWPTISAIVTSAHEPVTRAHILGDTQKNQEVRMAGYDRLGVRRVSQYRVSVRASGQACRHGSPEPVVRSARLLGQSPQFTVSRFAWSNRTSLVAEPTGHQITGSAWFLLWPGAAERPSTLVERRVDMVPPVGVPNAHLYAVRSTSASPVAGSIGTDTCSWVMSQRSPIARKHAVQRSHCSLISPVVRVPLFRLRLCVNATSWETATARPRIS